MNRKKTFWISISLSCFGCIIGHCDTEPVVQMNDVVWGKQIGTADHDSLVSVAVDSKNNVYAIGSTGGALTGQNFGQNDAFFIKFTSDGEELYRRQIGTAEDESGAYIICDSRDNVFVTGTTNGQLGDQRVGGRDIFLAKYTADGDLIWLTQYGSEQDDQSSSIELDQAGNIFVCAGTNGVMGEANLGKQDGVITKLNADGEVQWHVQFGTPELEYARGICFSSQGVIYSVSSFYMTNISSIIEVSPDGKILKQKDLTDMKMMDVLTDGKGDLYISGHDKGISMFARLDKDFGRVWLKTFKYGNWSGEKEIRPLKGNLYATAGCMNWPKCAGFVRVYDEDGTLKYWNKIRKSTDFDSEDSTCGNFLAVDSDGAIYHVGGTDENLYTLNAGEKDGFLCKIEL